MKPEVYIGGAPRRGRGLEIGFILGLLIGVVLMAAIYHGQSLTAKEVTDQKTRIIQEVLSKTIKIEVAPDGSSLTITTPEGLPHPTINPDFHGWRFNGMVDERENHIVTFTPPRLSDPEPYTPPQETPPGWEEK